MKKLIVISFILGINLVIPVKNIACPIPVFRYALEFWEAEPYRLEIFYRNSLGPGGEDLVNYLITTWENEVKSNFIMRTVNVEGDDHDIPESIIKDLLPGKGALMVLRYPYMSGINSVIWSAPLNEENVDLLLNSPVRETITSWLSSNATAVWIFLESGDIRRDRSAIALLERELRRLEQTLVLPDYNLWLGDHSSVSEGNFPKIKFDVLRVSRNDPREEILVRMLMNSEHYLDKFKSEPIVFPLYGRGIALWAIIGDRIDEINITRAAEFLTGPCSCQVKSLNPGIDLLISADWDNLVDNIADINIANPLSGMGDFTSRETEVRRQLESATLERLGTASIDGDATISADQYSDLAKEKMHENEVLSFTEGSYKRISADAADQSHGRMDIKYVFGLIIAGIIILVFICSIILFRTRK